MTGNAELQEQSLDEQVQQLNARMEELAVAGEWSEVAHVMAERNLKLQSIDNPLREASLVAARRATIRVQRLAESAKQEVGEKLSQLQRGKRATDSYLAHA